MTLLLKSAVERCPGSALALGLHFDMTSFPCLRLARGVAIAVFCLAALGVPSLAHGDEPPAPDALLDALLDPVLRMRARELAGRSRVIVEFKGTLDPRAITGHGGVAGRPLEGGGGQVADIDNQALARVARDPRVARIIPDRRAFATLERTGAAIGANDRP